jgi:hypothetical protein
MVFRAPGPNLFLRPEEQHVVSGEDDVVPPLCSRNQVVEEPVGNLRSLKTDAQVERLLGLRASRVNCRRLVQRRGDSQHVAGAVGKVLDAIRFQAMLGGNA